MKKISLWIYSLFSIIFALFSSLLYLNAITEISEESESWEISSFYFEGIDTENKIYHFNINDAQTRNLTYQITFRNKSQVKTYQPGELKIVFEDPFAIEFNSTNENNFAITADPYYSTDKKHDWNYTVGWKNGENSILNNENKVNVKYYTLTNSKVIEAKANFEGSIQISKQLTSSYIIFNQKINIIPKLYINNQEVAIASETSITTTNTTAAYTMVKQANKIGSLDDFPAGDYLWIKYTLYAYKSEREKLDVEQKELYMIDTLPENCIMLDSNKQQLTPISGNTYKISFYKELYNFCYSSNFPLTIYVGYPASEYEGKTITNNAELYGKRILTITNSWLSPYNLDIVPVEKIAESSVTFNIDNFKFEYTGDLYSINKSFNSGTTISQNLIQNGIAFADIRLPIKAYYTGTNYNLRFGDDIVGIYENGTYTKLTDDEYYFKFASFGAMHNMDSNALPDNAYNCELWVRRANNSEYELYSTFTNVYAGGWGKEFNFSKEDKIVGYYFEVKDLNKSVIINPQTANRIVINKDNIAKQGTIYNFARIEVYMENQSGILELKNEPDLSSYSTISTKYNIATYDMENYGHYCQRTVASYDYGTEKKQIDAATSLSSYKNDIEKEKFTSNLYFSSAIYNTTTSQYMHYLEMYSLLPEGMEIDLKKSEIEDYLKNQFISSITSTEQNTYSFFKRYCKKYNGSNFTTEDAEYLVDKMKINIIENYKGTNRILISIIFNFKDEPINILNIPRNGLGSTSVLSFNIPVKVTYDNFIEYGNIYKNEFFTMIEFDQGTQWSSTWNFANDTYDLNDNSITNESYYKQTTNINIVQAIATYQDIQTQTQTELNNYTTDIADTLTDKSYTYKLRVRTGTARVTNLIIYTNIEEAYRTKNYWQGTFEGIDTSFAESQGYLIKVYYSENPKAGKISDDNSWKVYDEATTDKTKVKSLAFEYLDSTNAAAIIPANKLTYVLVKMKSPTDENITTLAYNKCFSQWNAINDLGQIVQEITGMESNTVKVALPLSVKTNELPTVTLKIVKEIIGDNSDFNNMLLNKNNEHLFKITLTNLIQNEFGTYDKISGLVSSTQGLIITQIPIGTYLLTESDDNYFDFIDFTDNNDSEIIIEGVTFEKTDQGYIITIDENLSETIEFNIKVTNQIEPERYYEDKEYKENLILKNKLNT